MKIKKVDTINSFADDITSRAREHTATRARHGEEKHSLLRGWEERFPMLEPLPSRHPSYAKHPAQDGRHKPLSNLMPTDAALHRDALIQARHNDEARRIEARHTQEARDAAQHAQNMIEHERSRALQGFETQHQLARKQIQLIAEFAWLHAELSTFLTTVRRTQRLHLSELFRRFDQSRLAEQREFILLAKRNLYAASETGNLVRQAFSGRPIEEVVSEIALPIVRERSQTFTHHQEANRWSVGDTGLVSRLPIVGNAMERATFEASVPVIDQRTKLFADHHINNRWIIADAGVIQRLAVLGEGLSLALATSDQPLKAKRTRDFLNAFYAQRFAITANNGIVPLFRLGNSQEHVAAKRSLPLTESRTAGFDRDFENDHWTLTTNGSWSRLASVGKPAEEVAADFSLPMRIETTTAHKLYRDSHKFTVTTNDTIRRLVYVGDNPETVNSDLSARLRYEITAQHDETRTDANRLLQQNQAARSAARDKAKFETTLEPRAAKKPEPSPMTQYELLEHQRPVRGDAESIKERDQKLFFHLTDMVEEVSKKLAAPYPITQLALQPITNTAEPRERDSADLGTVKQILPLSTYGKKIS